MAPTRSASSQRPWCTGRSPTSTPPSWSSPTPCGADAFIALPGGIGTLEEFFEAWTAGALGMHDKPLVLLDPLGHYDGLLAWLRSLVTTGYVSPRAMERLVIVTDVDDALDACAPARNRSGGDIGAT